MKGEFRRKIDILVYLLMFWESIFDIFWWENAVWEAEYIILNGSARKKRGLVCDKDSLEVIEKIRVRGNWMLK